MQHTVIDVESRYQELYRYLHVPDNLNTSNKVNQILVTLTSTPDGLTKTLAHYKDLELPPNVLWGITNILVDIVNELADLKTSPNTVVSNWYSKVDHQILMTERACKGPMEWLNEIEESGYTVSNDVVKFFQAYTADIPR